MSQIKSKTRFEVHLGPLTAMNIETICYTTSNWQTDIFEWKDHIVRSVNQEAAKQDQLKTISTYPNCTCIGNNGLGNEVPSA